MILGWMVYVLATSLLVALAAVAAERALRLSSLPGRWAWASALIGSLGLAGLPWVAPGSPPVPQVVEATAVPTADVGEAIAPPSALTRPLLSVRALPAVRALDIDALDPALVAGWIALSLGTLALVARAGWRLRRARAAWETRYVDGTPLLVSGELGPAVVGFRRPAIVLPAWAFEGDADLRRLMIAHEKEHLRARDQWLLAAGLVVVVLLPWNAVLWWQLRRLRHAVELDCDARVVRKGENVRSYGELLLAVSRRRSPRLSMATAFAEPTSYLERRIRALIAAPPRHRWWIAAVAVTGCVALVAGACEIPRPVDPGAARAGTQAPDEQAGGGQLREVAEVRVVPAALARTVEDLVAARHPDLYEAGPRPGQTIWFAVNREGEVLDSWVAPAFTGESWKSLMESGRFRGLDLVPWTFEIMDRRGRELSVVWAEPEKPWTGSPPPVGASHVDGTRKLIAEKDASLLAGRVRPGESIWVLERARQTPAAPVDLRMWTAPSIADLGAQSEYLRTRVASGRQVIAANFDVRGDDGEAIPVVYAMELRSR